MTHRPLHIAFLLTALTVLIFGLSPSQVHAQRFLQTLSGSPSGSVSPVELQDGDTDQASGPGYRIPEDSALRSDVDPGSYKPTTTTLARPGPGGNAGGSPAAFRKPAWYERTWDVVRRIPRAYWETARSGEQISALSGWVAGVTDRMNPFGGGLDYGPLMGQQRAYRSGRRTGNLTGDVENTVLLATGVYGLARSTPRMIATAPSAIRGIPRAVRSIPQAVRNAPGAVRNTASRAWQWARGGRGASQAAQAVQQPNRIYSFRVLQRAAQEPGPYHNFPGSFDEVIFSQGQRSVVPNYFRTPRANMGADSINYTLRGHLNGRPGTYEIFARPSASGRTEVIMHRFFRPD